MNTGNAQYGVGPSLEAVGSVGRGLIVTGGNVSKKPVTKTKKLLQVNSRRRPVWLCRDYHDDPSDPIYPVVCRSKRYAVAVTKAQGYPLPPIPVYE